jgi:ABC-type amino acid transport substrate-binding protein
MKKLQPHTVLRYFALCLLASTLAMLLVRRPAAPPTLLRDYADIDTARTLRAVTDYNAIAFYADTDSLAGFHYELAGAFARHHGWTLSMTPAMTFRQRLEGIVDGRYDLIANGIPVTDRLRDTLLFTRPIVLTKQVLVQRRPATPADDTLYIKSQLDLAGRTLYVVKGSPALLRISNLSNEIGDTIYVRQMGDYGAEQLIALVAHGDIDYAVCDENIARAALDSLPQLDIDTDISFTQFYAWAVGRHAPALRDSINTWLDTYLQSRDYRRLYAKYFK